MAKKRRGARANKTRRARKPAFSATAGVPQQRGSNPDYPEGPWPYDPVPDILPIRPERMPPGTDPTNPIPKLPGGEPPMFTPGGPQQPWIDPAVKPLPFRPVPLDPIRPDKTNPFDIGTPTNPNFEGPNIPPMVTPTQLEKIKAKHAKEGLYDLDRYGPKPGFGSFDWLPGSPLPWLPPIFKKKFWNPPDYHQPTYPDLPDPTYGDPPMIPEGPPTRITPEEPPFPTWRSSSPSLPPFTSSSPSLPPFTSSSPSLPPFTKQKMTPNPSGLTRRK